MSGKHIAVALIAGANAIKNIDTPPAVKDRWNALRRAIMKRSDQIPITHFEDQAGIAAKLDEHHAMEDRAIVTTARELLMLIRLEDQARAAVEPMMDEIHAAHAALSAVNLDEQSERAASSRKLSEGKLPAAPLKSLPVVTQPPKATLTSKPKAELLLETERGARPAKSQPPPSAAETKPSPSTPDAPAPISSDATPKVPAPDPVPPPPRTSRRFAPPEEPSKTELERTALPIWQRTEHFFMKAGALVVAYIIAFCVYWFFIRTDDAMAKCRAGEAPRCWEVVAVQDTVDQGKKVQLEPLQLLCDKYNDPCGCAGVAYLKAAEAPATSAADCSELQHASQLDPAWACTCTRYGFWKYGKDRTAQCGIARCD